jgi:hypothetical protein
MGKIAHLSVTDKKILFFCSIVRHKKCFGNQDGHIRKIDFSLCWRDASKGKSIPRPGGKQGGTFQLLFNRAGFRDNSFRYFFRPSNSFLIS